MRYPFVPATAPTPAAAAAAAAGNQNDTIKQVLENLVPLEAREQPRILSASAAQMRVRRQQHEAKATQREEGMRDICLLLPSPQLHSRDCQ